MSFLELVVGYYSIDGKIEQRLGHWDVGVGSKVTFLPEARRSLPADWFWLGMGGTKYLRNCPHPGL